MTWSPERFSVGVNLFPAGHTVADIDFNLTFIQKSLWFFQFVAIALFLTGRKSDWSKSRRAVSLSFCFLAIALAWVWRLAYQFVLSSGGFAFFVPDDPTRWGMAHAWARDPFFVTWDGIWLGATFYLHGAAMWIVDDPLLASKFVSVLYNVLPLAGIFIFTQSLYRDRLISSVAVLFAAPWWHHILLGSGAMTEMPVVGLMLGASGFLIMGLKGPIRRRLGALCAAAACYFLATAFHYIAWLQLAAVLVVLLIYSLASRSAPERFGLRSWFFFSLASTGYCILWALGCWIKFGDPLYFLKGQAALNALYMGEREPLELLSQYPLAIIYSLWSLFPLTVFGAFRTFFPREQSSATARMALITIGVALALMMATTLTGGTNAAPYRSIAPIAAALFPIAMAPMLMNFSAWLDRRNQSRAQRSAGSLALALILLVIAGLWLIDNHQMTLSRQRMEEPLDSDSIALGSWIRQEFLRPQRLSVENLALPLRLWIPQEANLHSLLTVEYLAGIPSRIQRRFGDPDPDVDSLQTGQILIAHQPVTHERLTPILEIGVYVIYEAGREPEPD